MGLVQRYLYKQAALLSFPSARLSTITMPSTFSFDFWIEARYFFKLRKLANMV